MSTTDILYNSPALHALKRAQLVQLCKRHNIKAAGKNTELIERLKQHALTLKLCQARAKEEKENRCLEGGDGNNDDLIDELDSAIFDKPTRPSEMWEIVMDDIPEEESGGSSNSGSLKSKASGSLGVGAEFGGTGGSSKSTVSSSIKAFASSLGLKRALTASESGTLTSSSRKAFASSSNTNMAPGQPRESLLANAIPYGSMPSSSSQPLSTEPFAFSYSAHDTSLQLGEGGADVSMSSLDRPIPGVGSRSGVEVAGLGATAGAGTIRLITNNYTSMTEQSSSLAFESPPRLTAVQPAFDLVPPTPGGLNATRWPMTPGRPLTSAPSSDDEWKGIYPSIPPEERDEKKQEDEDVDMPGGLSTPQQQHPVKAISTSALSPPQQSDVFIFGSPHAKSKADFNKAASSVLAEMNSRLGLVGAQALGAADILGNRATGNSNMTESEILNYEFGGSSDSKEKEQSTMEGNVKSKFDRAHEKEFAKMDGIATHYSLRRNANKEDASEHEPLGPLPANRKRKSNVLDANQPKLGRGRPSAAARRNSNARVISAGTRKKLGMGLPGAFGNDDDEDHDEEDAADERQAKRARPSEAPEKRISIAPKPEESEDAKKEREMIRRRLELQKARRRSSRGRPSMGGPRVSLANQKRLPKPAPSRFGFLSSAAKSIVKSVWNRGAGNPTPAPSALPVPTKPAAVPASSTSGKEKPPIPSAKKPSFAGLQKPPTTNSSAASRVSVAAGTRSASASSTGLLNAKEKSGTVMSSRSNISVATTNTSRSRSPIPPFDGQDTAAKGSVSSKMSSIGVATGTGSSRRGSARSSVQPRRTTRPSSTLLAPTASSLAKMNARTSSRPLPVPPSINTHTSNSVSQHPEPVVSPISPSKIPVILPLSPRKKSLYPGSTVTSPTTNGGGEGMKSPKTRPTSIFSTPLVVPTTPGVNPITGLPSPSRIPLATSAAAHTNAAPTSSTATGGNTLMKRGPSVQRKPRISRSKVIAKLGAQRAASATYHPAATTQGDEGQGQQQGLGPVIRPANNSSKGRSTRSSIGIASSSSSRRIRSSVGGAGCVKKASLGLGGPAQQLLSARRRARASEYARRRSEKVRVPAPTLSVSAGEGGEESMTMELDA